MVFLPNHGSCNQGVPYSSRRYGRHNELSSKDAVFLHVLGSSVIFGVAMSSWFLTNDTKRYFVDELRCKRNQVSDVHWLYRLAFWALLGLMELVLEDFLTLFFKDRWMLLHLKYNFQVHHSLCYNKMLAWIQVVKLWTFGLPLGWEVPPEASWLPPA
jgi:hypothetical protein